MTTPAFDILDALPHRPPFRFLSEVVSLCTGESGEAVWRVSGSEPFFEGHFPDGPIVPGVLITEALAQLSGLVGFHQEALDKASIDPGSPAPVRSGKLAHVEIRFSESVAPPADIMLKSRQVRALGALHQFDVEASFQGISVARGRLTLAVSTAPPEPQP